MIITNKDLRFFYNKIKEFNKDNDASDLMINLLKYTPYASFLNQTDVNNFLNKFQSQEEIEKALSNNISFNLTDVNRVDVNLVEGLCNLNFRNNLLLYFIDYKGIELLQEIINNSISRFNDYRVPPFKKSGIKYNLDLLSKFVVKNYKALNSNTNDFSEEIVSLTRYCLNEKNKETKTRSLFLINELIKKDYKKDVIIELISSFIKNSSLLNGKPKKLFEEILTHFSDEEVKKYFPLKKLDAINNISNTLYEEKEVKTYIIKINLFKIEDTTHRGIVRKNMKSYMCYLDRILEDMPGYCFSSSKSSDELIFNVAVEKDKGDTLNELHKKILNTILESNDIVTWDWLKKTKDVFLLNNVLEKSLNEEVKTKKLNKL